MSSQDLRTILKKWGHCGREQFSAVLTNPVVEDRHKGRKLLSVIPDPVRQMPPHHSLGATTEWRTIATDSQYRVIRYAEAKLTRIDSVPEGLPV